jgi:hypothetical protein
MNGCHSGCCPRPVARLYKSSGDLLNVCTAGHVDDGHDEDDGSDMGDVYTYGSVMAVRNVLAANIFQGVGRNGRCSWWTHGDVCFCPVCNTEVVVGGGDGTVF